MPLYVGDYLADTRRLSTLEHGAYLLLIMDYWQNGSIPTDDAALARIAGMSGKEWGIAKKSISPLFQDGWHHKRIDAELVRAEEKSKSARASAEASWSSPKRSGRNANASANAEPTQCEGICETDAHARVPQSPISPTANAVVDGAPRPKRAKQRSMIKPEAQPSSADRAAALASGLDEPRFRAEWQRFRDHHIAKGNLMADWSAAWRTWLGNIAQFQPKSIGSKDDQDGTSVHRAVRSLAASGFDLGPKPAPYMLPGRGDAPGRDTPRLLSQGGGSGTGNLRRGSDVGLVLLPGAGRLSGDGPEDGLGWPEPVASNGG